ncbi:MAG TPA: bifunctional precorrin-2 dehydrogenase/sirohydrochlorin ferrochelatase [Longimicrobiaceae bacterium]|nr:bifunctional precorrin-2 dehydrogenase/sirohydrochlorin ferrochelatase [Longimicrobiaceae bacterium]
MSALYPVLLDLSRVRVLVVGGGAVATRKVEGLLESGGRPTVVAPVLSPELRGLAEREGLPVLLRPYAAGDAAGYALVFAATDRPEVNARVAREAREAGALASVADAGGASDFHLPASIRRGGVVVAFSTGGASPLLSRRLRERLEDVVTPGVGRAAGRLEAVRDEVRARWPDDEPRRRAFWFDLITPDFLESAIRGRDEEVEARISRCLSQS